MRRRRLLWQLFPAFLLIVLLALAGSGWYITRALRTFHLEQTAVNLEARARLVEDQIAEQMILGQEPQVDALLRRLGAKTGTRLTAILAGGQVVGDSHEDPQRMDNHAGRPEIAQALLGGVGVSTRYSHTLQETMMYVAVPARLEQTLVGAVRTALPVTDIDRTLQAIYFKLLGGGFGVALIAVLVSLGVSRRITRPLEEMRTGAQRFAQGDLDQRLPVSSSVEIGGLAEALNQMAAQLDDRIKTVLRQRNEQDAVLGSMVEGVIAVDAEERILRLNESAARLFTVDMVAAQGRRIQEVVRRSELQRFIARSLDSRDPVEGDIVLHNEAGEVYLQAHGSVLRDSQGQNIGALVVLNDVTRLRKLESIRRDFAANVSHELKTPITAIKGFVETLLDGALEQKEDARRFLEIILRQSERLHAIIEDLLALSRIEQESESGGIPLQEERLKDVLSAAVQACEIGASAKKIEVELVCPQELTARINALLLEQAVVNLIDNAVKYSNPGERVQVEGLAQGRQALIRVQDWGCGIPNEHLPRLFERFYRVDKARSRKQGGTGLGLAIVKHIVQAHGGRIEASSVPGQGSVFTLKLPLSGAKK